MTAEVCKSLFAISTGKQGKAQQEQMHLLWARHGVDFRDVKWFIKMNRPESMIGLYLSLEIMSLHNEIGRQIKAFGPVVEKEMWILENAAIRHVTIMTMLRMFVEPTTD